MKKPLLYITTTILLGTAIYSFSNWDTIFGGETSVNASTLPTRAEIQQNFYSHRKVLFIYGSGIPKYMNKYKAVAENYKANSRWMDIEVKKDSETTIEDLQSKTVFIAGTPKSNLTLSELSRQLPLDFQENGFQVFDKSYQDTSDLVSFFYPNPLNPQFSVNILSGNSDENILNSLASRTARIFRTIGDYRISRGDRCLAMGFFSQDAATRWQFSPASHRDFEAEAVASLTTDYYRFILHRIDFQPEALSEISRRLGGTMENIHRFLGIESVAKRIDYHIYPSCEDKGLITRSTKLSEYRLPQHAVHSVITDGMRGDNSFQDAALILRSHLGQPKQSVLEMGLAIYFSNNWQMQGYEYWASRLHQSGNATPLADLLDNNMLRQESELVMPPLAGTFVAYLLEAYGKETFLQNYLNWEPEEGEIAKLESGWKQYLDKLSAAYQSQVNMDRREFPQVDGFQKGFCYAHEGYQIYNGYGSRKSDEALAKLSDIGTNAVSITPFSYMGDAKKPVFLRYSRRSGSESDESVIQTALSARKLGMISMMKPHIWLGRSWPGEVEMQSPQDWERFFGYYHRWIRHYALLSEMYKIEILCLGVELGKTTIAGEDGWRDIIKKMRALYSGKLTYAANWGEEFENLKFWDDLDFIGLNSYYPLSKSDAPTAEELAAGAEEIVKKIESVQKKYKRPVLLTEIGFTATPAPWKQPHEPAERRPDINQEHQAMCYQAIYESLYGKKWLKGIYWWKWPTYLEYGGERDSDFTPNGKPAEQIVREWNGKRWN